MLCFSLWKIASGLNFIYLYFGWEFYSHVIKESYPVPKVRRQQRLKEQFPSSPGVLPGVIQFCCHLSGYAKHPAVFQGKPRCSRDCIIPTTYITSEENRFSEEEVGIWSSQIWMPPCPTILSRISLYFYFLFFPKSHQMICLLRTQSCRPLDPVSVTAVFC